MDAKDRDAATGREFFDEVKFSLAMGRSPDGNVVVTIEPLSPKVKVRVKRDKREPK